MIRFRILIMVAFSICVSMPLIGQDFNLSAKENENTSKVIAHRGFWKVTAQNTQNSVEALQAAIDAGFYGSETDVRITKDGVLMVNHDADLNGVNIEKSTYDEVKNLKLSNGESLPTLSELLDVMDSNPDSGTKLIIEVKSHDDPARTLMAAKEAVNMVRRRGLENRVEYIAFSMEACMLIRTLDSEAQIAYLNGGLSPLGLKNLGNFNLDYHMNEYRAHPEWIEEARNLGLTVNVWTVNDNHDLEHFIEAGVDYITTDIPDIATLMLQNSEGK